MRAAMLFDRFLRRSGLFLGPIDYSQQLAIFFRGCHTGTLIEH